MSSRTLADRLPVALLAVAVVACGVVLVALQSDLTFWLDEWDFLLHRRDFDADALLAPHNEHIAVLPVLLYKALLSSFGMDSQLPFQLAQIASSLVVAVLLFVYVRRRLGDWPALVAVVPILFLGAAWGNLLSAFQIAFFASMACGIAALLVGERAGRRGDPIVCGLLVAAILWQSLGVAFVAGVAVGLAFGADRLRRVYVVAVPSAVYALWWLGWGVEAESFVSLDNLLASPGFVVDGVAASIASLFGIVGTGPESESLTWGRPLLAAAVALAAWRLWRVRAVSRSLVVVVAIGLTFWLLVALNASELRTPTNGRYQYTGAVLVVMIAVDLLRGVRVDSRILAVCFAVAIAAAASGANTLEQNSRFLTAIMERQRAGLAALEIARDTVAPGFLLTAENSDAIYFDYVDARSYLSAVDAFGSPAYTPVELATAPEPARVAADKALVAALPVRFMAVDGEAGRRCREATPGADARSQVTLPPGGALLRAAAGADVGLRLRRFASLGFPIEVGLIPSGKAAALTIPPDRAAQSWQLELEGAGALLVCEHAAPVGRAGHSDG